MTEQHDRDLGLAPSLASIHISSQLGGTPELWLYRLANWRRPGRSSPITFGKTEAGNPTYSVEALNTFISEQLAKQALVAESQAAALVRAGALAKLDSADETPHVRVSFAITGASQSVFAINAGTARQLAGMLTKAAEAVEAFASVGSA